MRFLLSSGCPTRTLPRPALFVSLLFALLALVGFAPHRALAAVYTVTDNSDSASDTNSLPYALSVAVTGDEVNIAPGVGTITLSSTLNISQGITLNGNGAVLNGNGSVGVLNVSGGTADNPVVLNGLTIENGYAGDGGGIYSTGTATLTNCTFTGNSIQGGNGGGICSTGTATLTNCTFTGNSAQNGGCIYSTGTATLTNCTLTENSAVDGGGLLIDGTATVTSCTLTGNSATNSGGSLYNNHGTATVTNCVLTGNNAAFGGGLYNFGPATVTNCVFTGNSATGYGYGGGLCNVGPATVTNCTLTGNSAQNGGDLYNISGTATLTNDILYGDTAPTGNEVSINSGSVTASYCDIAGGFTGTGNQEVTPNFVRTPFTNGTNDMGDLHLQSGSPCAGTGATQAQAPSGVTIPATDLDGRARPSSPSIGAYEAAPTGDYPLVVENSGDGSTATGVSVYDTVTGATNTVTVTAALPMSLRADVQCANDYADAQITFDATVFTQPTTITETLGTLSLTNPMSITGPAAGVAVSGNHANQVMNVSGGMADDPLLLSGLTIENGSNNGGNGGGIYNTGTDTLTDCTLTGNSANQNGLGGGFFNFGTATLTNCTLIGNSARGSGGGLDNEDGTVTLTNCTLTGNSANTDGGGLWNGGNATLTNCTLTGNTTNTDGGGLDNNGGTATLTNCTFTGNSSEDGGGGLCKNSGTVTLTNDILFGDTAMPGVGNDVYLFNGSISASYCDIAGGYAGTDNLDANPEFVDDPIVNFNVTPPTSSNGFGDLHLQPDSPCIGMGATQAQAPSGVTIPTTDITGITRPTPPSIGAFDVAVNSVTTGTSLQSSQNPSGPNQVVTLTATVTANGAPVTVGSVAFDIAGTITSEPVNANGQAMVTTSVLPTGSDSISAAYTDAGGIYAGSNSSLMQNMVSLTVSAPSTATVGTPVPVTITTDLSTYTGPVTLSSSDGAATFSPPTVILSRGVGTTDVTFNTPGSQTVTATDAGSPADTAITGTSGNVSVIGTPTANGQTVNAGFDTAKAITLTGSDPDSPPLTLTYAIATNPAHGTLSGFNASTGAVTYTPDTGYTGPDSFTFTVNNGTNASPAATVTINVATGTPTANPQSVSTNESTAASITLTGSDPDNPSLTLTYAIGTGPAHGTLSGFNASAGAVTYTPAIGYFGPDSFTFTVSNGTNTSAAATVSVTVNQVIATVTGVSATWGSRTDALTAASNLLPSGRKTDVPWQGITSFTVTLNAAETLNTSDISVTGKTGANYGPVTVSGSGTTYTLTLAQTVNAADVLTLTVGNANITTLTGTLPVLPGDVGDAGSVSASSMVLARNAIGTGNAFADINGDNAVNVTDYNLVRMHIGNTLP